MLFLSYSRNDIKPALEIEAGLSGLGWEVFRDEVGISAGTEWRPALDTNLRKARAMVLLVSPASRASNWVTYEYAFASGAGIPVVSVSLKGAKAPKAIRHFQSQLYPSPDAFQRIHDGLLVQIREAKSVGRPDPTLVAKFYEKRGCVHRQSDDRIPELLMELWVEHAPATTTEVAFNILEDVVEPEWTIKRQRRPAAREFLTDDISLWGDVDIVARGALSTGKSWTTRSRLYDALVRYYATEDPNADVRRALKQIRQN